MTQNLLVPPHSSSLCPVLWEEETHHAKAFAKDQHAQATRRAYQTDIRLFDAWCQERGLCSLPALPQTVSVFLAWGALEKASVSALARRASAIQYYHRLAGHEPPTQSEVVKATLKGIRRTLGVAPCQKVAATVDRLQDMLCHVPDTLQGKRDKALLLLGFSGAFRRSELSALLVSDLEETDQGLRVRIRHSKTDQEGMGQEVAIYRGVRLKPVEALKTWLEASQITSGFVFRSLLKGGKISDNALSPFSVACIVKKYAQLAGFCEKDFAGHSLRSGFLTTAAERGASLFKMMEVSRHKSVDTLKGYIRRADLFKDHAGQSFL